jgi:hypothetical protein
MFRRAKECVGTLACRFRVALLVAAATLALAIFYVLFIMFE